MFVLLEAFACIQISLGLFSDLGAESKLRAERISATLEQRREQLAAAIENGGNVEGLTRIVNSLENAVQQALQQAQALETERLSLLMFGLLLMAMFKTDSGTDRQPGAGESTLPCGAPTALSAPRPFPAIARHAPG